ncbi:hypothetical protein JY651_27850 [Pyxidicoccus parkwayensis]|uniref:Uncharacterized protein n=1 Tax=Pyxidicoccus parkwayensis TaxID=2813578 RepID=A0ABX7NNX1_9BACT|nr:hypothetical protein [Pyxidicoccus parkwaysis]QSQ19159.1 hypothetical protein JY651_27850 [Pyxidicoccus parkwaysis]
MALFKFKELFLRNFDREGVVVFGSRTAGRGARPPARASSVTLSGVVVDRDVCLRAPEVGALLKTDARFVGRFVSPMQM